jgi:hypothetical protein
VTTVVVLAALVAVVATSWGVVQPAGSGGPRPAASETVGDPLVAVTAPDPTPTPAPSDLQAAPVEAEAPAGFAEDTRTLMAAGLSAADRAAGLRSAGVPRAGTGRLVTVPGSVPGPGTGTLHRVRVRVEGGLDVDAGAFAAFVMATLNDPRSWGHGGRRTFARVDDRDASKPDITVVLASPTTSASMCRPLQTRGTLSCAQGRTAILTLHRWVRGASDYGGDRTGYRQYLVNHEVGHVLGQGHQSCPGRGRRAPVMMQQTKGLAGCTTNPWPSP